MLSSSLKDFEVKPVHFYKQPPVFHGPSLQSRLSELATLRFLLLGTAPGQGMQLEGCWDGREQTDSISLPGSIPALQSQLGMTVTQQSDSDQTLSQPWSEAAALQIQGGLSASSTIPCGCSTQHLLLHPPWTPKSLGLGCFRALCLLSAQGQAGWIVPFPAPSAPQTQPRVCVPVPAPALCPRCGWACSRCWHQLHVPGVQSRSLTLAARSCLAPRLRERLWKIPVGSCHVQPVAPSDPDKSLSSLGLVCHVQVDFVCLKLGWGRNCSTSCV